MSIHRRCFSLVMGPVHSSTHSTSWGAYSPCCHSGTINKSLTHSSIILQPGTSFTPGLRECIYRWSALPIDTAPHQGPRPVPRTSQSKVVGYNHHTLDVRSWNYRHRPPSEPLKAFLKVYWEACHRNGHPGNLCKQMVYVPLKPYHLKETNVSMWL